MTMDECFKGGLTATVLYTSSLTTTARRTQLDSHTMLAWRGTAVTAWGDWRTEGSLAVPVRGGWKMESQVVPVRGGWRISGSSSTKRVRSF